MQLYHTISALKRNSFGLQLKLEDSEDCLHQIYLEDSKVERDVLWQMETLRNALEKKHRETFWVGVKTQGKRGEASESFWYSDVVHTGGLDKSAFPILLESGVITVDYTIYEEKTASEELAAGDHGYLFKILPSQLHLLFTNQDHYDLTSLT